MSAHREPRHPDEKAYMGVAAPAPLQKEWKGLAALLRDALREADDGWCGPLADGDKLFVTVACAEKAADALDKAAELAAALETDPWDVFADQLRLMADAPNTNDVQKTMLRAIARVCDRASHD